MLGHFSTLCMKGLKENYDYMLTMQKATLSPVDTWPKPKAQKTETAIKSCSKN